jgi:formiminotetrahydrofolate cyclodeaminase
LADAVLFAVRCPRDIMTAAAAGLALADAAGADCRPHLVADVLVAAELLAATLRGAYHIAAANLPWIDPPARRQEEAATLADALARGEQALEQTRRHLRHGARSQGDSP